MSVAFWPGAVVICFGIASTTARPGDNRLTTATNTCRWCDERLLSRRPPAWSDPM